MVFRASKTPLILGHSRPPLRSRCFSPVLGRIRTGSFPYPKQAPVTSSVPSQRTKLPLRPYRNDRLPVTSVSVANPLRSSRPNTIVDPVVQPQVVQSFPRDLLEPTVPVRREVLNCIRSLQQQRDSFLSSFINMYIVNWFCFLIQFDPDFPGP